MKAYAMALTLCVALSAGATAPDDPWALVPALPSGCYRQQDDFLENVAAGLESLDQEIRAQEAINDELGSQMGDMAEQDPFALAQRMQQYMMDNPEEGMKMMEGLYATGQTLGDEVSEDNASEVARGAALDDLITNYRAAYVEMRAPIDARWEALPTYRTEAGPALTEEAYEQLPSIARQANAAYEELCAEWWQPGPFPAWLEEFHSYLTEERVPRNQNLEEQGRQQWEIHGVDTSNFHPVANMNAARAYLQTLKQIYVERKARPSSFHRTAGVEGDYDDGIY